jgi:oxygen-independent coproporphyrinogen-3 oxidase
VLGLYLHIPFCRAICHYCNFNREVFDPELKGPYVAALEREIHEAGDGRSVDAVYFGGGTPSLLEPVEIERLIGVCAAAYALAPGAEVTVEANPETATRAWLAACRRAGVNRLSLGVQSFRDDELRRLGRLHDTAGARRAVAEARDVGFDNVSLDLMAWLPGQSLEDWRTSVEALVALEPEHGSLYLFERHSSTPLGAQTARTCWPQAPDDEAAAMYLWALDRLDAAGYEHYEISSVARPGRRARHNLKYWTSGTWRGFGCGAHSTVDGVRWYNVSGVKEYVSRVMAGRCPVIDRRTLAPREQLEEAMFMGLRLAEGVDLGDVGRRYASDVWGFYGTELKPHVEAGLLVRTGDRLYLSRPGMLLANEILSAFV